MRIIKKTFCLLLSFIMVFGLYSFLTLEAYAADIPKDKVKPALNDLQPDNYIPIHSCSEPIWNQHQSGDYSYIIFDDDTVGIMSYSGNAASIDFPSVLDGHKVSSLGYQNYGDILDNPDSVTSITIPDSVDTIAGNVFRFTSNLKSIDFTSSVKSIGHDAFCGCTELSDLPFNGDQNKTDIRYVGSSAFYGTKWYNDLPDGVVYIDNVAYGYKGDFPDRITIKDGITAITQLGFAVPGAEAIKSIIIPESVVSIGYRSCGYIFIKAEGYKKVDGYTVYGYSGSVAETYAVDNDFTFISLDNAGYCVSGIITSSPDGSETAVRLTGVDVNYSDTVTGKAEYAFTGVPSGVYTLTVSKADHITREYSITVADKDVTEDVELCPLGDVTGDGKTNVQDCTSILRYVRKLDTDLSDYQLKCGDVTGDGKVNVQDVTRILRHVRKIEALY